MTGSSSSQFGDGLQPALLQSYIVGEATGPLSGLEEGWQISGLLACCEAPKAHRRRVTQTEFACTVPPREQCHRYITHPKVLWFPVSSGTNP